MVSSDHRVYSNNDLTSALHIATCDDFMRSHNLVIGYFADIRIADITAGQRNRCFIDIGSHRQNLLYGIGLLYLYSQQTDIIIVVVFSYKVV